MSAKSFLKKPAYKRMLIAILIGMMLTATSTIVSVKASPITVTVSPDSGPVGTTVTVSGDGASADGEVRVYLGFFWTGYFLATTTANSAGEYSVDITMPAVPAGPSTILVYDVATRDTAMTTFTIEPKIILTPKEGSYNDEVTVKGSGFNSGSTITLTFDGDDVTPTPPPETDDWGSFEAKFNVPKKSKGIYTVNASDGINVDSASFTMIPKIMLNPTSGPPSTLIFVDGTGFAPSVEVSVEFNAINVTAYPSVFTDPDGSFTQVFFVPDVPDETYTVKATDKPGNSASAPFVVPSPILTLEPSTTFSSSIVSAKGSGFPPNQPVLLYFEDNIVVSLLDLMTESQKLFADEYGSYEYSFTVPVTKPGVYTVTAYSVLEEGAPTIGEELASASLTIVEDPTLATIVGNLTDINARLVSIEGNVATIETDIGTIKADVSDIKTETVPRGYELAVASTILALIAAVGAWLSAVLIQRKKMPPKSKAKSK